MAAVLLAKADRDWANRQLAGIGMDDDPDFGPRDVPDDLGTPDMEGIVGGKG